MQLMRNATLLTLSSALVLSACSDDLDKTRTGAAVGAVAGIMSGVLTDDDSNGTIKRGIAGAAIGSLVGYSLDQQEADLRQDLSGSGALITNTGDQLIVTLPEAITFDVDSTYVRPNIQSTLQSLAGNLNQYPNSGVDVIGHTDNTGSASYNQDLSARRADAVSAILVGAGVSSARIRSYGLGETSPTASNDTAEGRAQNRRVEIVITPNA